MSTPGLEVPGRLGRYRLIERVGAGGMGVVYRAHDEHLDRDVALKVLPASLLTDETARSRFRREALTLSQLNHPGIAAIHDLDSENGVDFLTMEYVEGETLAAKIAAGPLPEDQVIALGAQLAEALEEAHEHRVIHRDLKPANVMVTTKGRVKILDFGLAKLVRSTELDAPTATLTKSQTGTVLGTLPYMAPEQLEGEPADARTDIYALGTVLYEMATGRRAFPQRQSPALIASILTEPPQPPRAPTGQVSAGLEATVLKALEKDPEQRYQSAKDLLEDLERLTTGAPLPRTGKVLSRKRWLVGAGAGVLTVLLAVLLTSTVAGLRRWIPGAGGAPPPIRSLAVLPLANLSGDPQQEYFADGMTEELITTLSKVGALTIIARPSVMQYKGTDKPAAQIAKELNVDGLVTGSVLREGGQVRITAQLIQAATGRNLWAESYQRDLHGVLAMQGEIAGAIAEKVRAALTPAERTRLASARLVDPEAYDAYLKGMQHWYNLTPPELDTAFQYFELALRKDPSSARAYTGIALVWVGRTQMGFSRPAEAVPRARSAALKAVALDDALAEAHYALALVRWDEYDWAKTEAEYKRAIELNSNDAQARAMYSHYLLTMKRPAEAMAQIQRALELDPHNGFFQAFYGVDLEFTGRYDEAIQQFRKALATLPDLPFAHWQLSTTFFLKGLYDESLSEMKADYAGIGDPEQPEILTKTYAQSGYQAAMRRAADLQATRARDGYVPHVDIADMYAMAGERDKALEWLEKSIEVRDPNMPYVGVDPIYDTLRQTPRFQTLLRRIKLPL